MSPQILQSVELSPTQLDCYGAIAHEKGSWQFCTAVQQLDLDCSVRLCARYFTSDQISWTKTFRDRFDIDRLDLPELHLERDHCHELGGPADVQRPAADEWPLIPIYTSSGHWDTRCSDGRPKDGALCRDIHMSRSDCLRYMHQESWRHKAGASFISVGPLSVHFYRATPC